MAATRAPGIFRRDQDALDRRDDAAALAGLVAFGDRVEIILRPQRIARVGRAQACTEDAPAQVPLAQHLVGIVGHVGAMEGADAEMDDAGLEPIRIVAEHLAGRARQAWHRRFPVLPVRDLYPAATC